MNAQELVKVLSRTEQDRIQAMGELSDHFKDVYGFRPKGFPSNMTWEEIAQTHKELSKMFKVEQMAEEEYKDKMNTKADSLCTEYKFNKEDLVRWGCFNREEIKI